MKLKEKTEKKKQRSPGAGRKPVLDKIKMIPFYIRESKLKELGGEVETRRRFIEWMGVV